MKKLVLKDQKIWILCRVHFLYLDSDYYCRRNFFVIKMGNLLKNTNYMRLIRRLMISIFTETFKEKAYNKG